MQFRITQYLSHLGWNSSFTERQKEFSKWLQSGQDFIPYTLQMFYSEEEEAVEV